MMRYLRTRRADAAGDGFPEELDPAFYRRSYPDLRGMTDAEARAHFAGHGIAEGRQGSALAVREALVVAVRRAASVLEIGPFCSPVLRGPNVAYFDVLDSAALRRRAAALGLDPAGVPEVGHVAADGDLAVVPDRFAAVVSAHCVEHQPDLIRHLQQVANLLEPGGRYFLIVPDRRYCFDHFIADSTLAGVVAAHVEGRRVHRLASVIEHRALTTHNWVERHWAGDHLDPGYREGMAARTRAAVAEFEAAAGGYVDVHAWQFTPASFRALTGALHEGGWSPLKPLRVYETPRGRNEFTAILGKDA